MIIDSFSEDRINGRNATNVEVDKQCVLTSFCHSVLGVAIDTEKSSILFFNLIQQSFFVFEFRNLINFY